MHKPIRGDKMKALLHHADSLAPIKTAVIEPTTKEAIAGAILATKMGYIKPFLFGNKKLILEIASELHEHINDYSIFDIDEGEATQAAIDMVHKGDIDVLMKGSLHTEDFMRPIVNSDNKLRTTRRMSGVMIIDIPTYHKPLFITDCTINISPNFETKKSIIQNVIEFASAFGITPPKVALLAPLEVPHKRIPITLEWERMKKLSVAGELKGGIIEGPLAFDLAISKTSAKIKGIKSEVAGDADILVVPDLNSGNILFKALHYLGGALNAGIVLGAKIPIILTSRSATLEERAISCQLARVYGKCIKEELCLVGEKFN